jgi:hypothetical protein
MMRSAPGVPVMLSAFMVPLITTTPCAIAAPVATRAVRAAIVPTMYLTFFI